jgi:chaperonin GroEL
MDLAGDEATGMRILRTALEQPLKLIAENTGVSGEVILSESLKSEGDWGYDAEVGDFTHLMERGIMDPAKVTRAAIENAASVASMVLTTETLITDIKEDTPAAPAMPPMDY